MQPGTVVACGTGDYKLTRKDLEHLVNASGAYDFALENGNIVIRATPTANEEIETASFRALVQDGALVLSGIEEGAFFRVYDAGGLFVSEGRVQAGFPAKVFSLSYVKKLASKCQVVDSGPGEVRDGEIVIIIFGKS